MAADSLGERCVRGGHETDRARDGCWHERRVHKWGQVDPCHTVGEVCGDVGGEGESEARLADPAWTNQRQKRHGLIEQECPSGGSIWLAPNEPGAGDRRGGW